MNTGYFEQEREFFKTELLENIVPFWLKYARDDECGGYFTCLRRDGSVYDLDKVSTWAIGRIAWSYAHLYNNLNQESAWLDMALHGVEFMRKHCFDDDGRMFGAVTRDGKPPQNATNIYHELFAAAAYGENFRATGDKELLREARRLVFLVEGILDHPESNPHRFYPGRLRPLSIHPEHLILLETVQMMRRWDEDPRYDAIALKCIDRIFELHYDEQHQAVFEIAPVGSDRNGCQLSPSISRWVCPGHMFELSWMLIDEGQHQRRHVYIDKGLRVAEWAMRWGWDTERGGIPNDINTAGEYCLGTLFPFAPLVLWWQMLEAIRATLLAYCVSGDTRFREQYEMVRDWSFEHFSDPEYGEWFGVLSPDGALLDGGAKATDIKSSQHTVRTLWSCYKLAEEQAGK